MIFSQDQLPNGWALLGKDDRQALATELKREVSKQHRLWGLKAVALARREGRDDVLFLIEGADRPLWVVQLSWKSERSPKWPKAIPFDDADDFLKNWKRIFA